MTLTVRLDETLEAALELHCAERGVTKSLVVQESLARYLIDQKQPASGTARAAEPSAAYRAFERAGFLGGQRSGASGGEPPVRSATRDVVRQRVRQRLERASPRR